MKVLWLLMKAAHAEVYMRLIALALALTHLLLHLEDTMHVLNLNRRVDYRVSFWPDTAAEASLLHRGHP